MKSKLAFATLLLTLTAAHSYAQKSMEWGLKAGGNYFKVGGRSFDNTYNVSFSGGAYAELNYTSKFTVQPELLFNQVLCKTSEGFTNIYSGLEPVGFQLVSLDYIAVPVLFVYKPVPLVSVIIGPQYSYLIAQTQGLLRAETSKDAFHHSELALVFGGQLNLGKLTLGLRYQEGLTNVNGINTTDVWRTYGFQLYLGFQLKDRKLK
ncbi:MAG TPA: outer membrane beta-barrel protein [Puia sp.]|nr:outer membrane beta-barrel protein [Puia sp.]